MHPRGVTRHPSTRGFKGWVERKRDPEGWGVRGGARRESLGLGFSGLMSTLRVTQGWFNGKSAPRARTVLKK